MPHSPDDFEVPHTPVTDEDFAALPILNLDEFLGGGEYLAHEVECETMFIAPHRPRRGDDIELWLKRMRNRHIDINSEGYLTVDWLLDRYRECADYGLSLRPEDDKHGNP